MTDFIKAADTKTTVAKSQQDAEKLLRRYGARSFSTSIDYEARVITVRFELPTTGAAPLSVKIPVSWATITDLLIKQRRGRVSPRDRQRIGEQAERVAWRHLYLFIDAALAAVSVGIQTAEEAFFAHAIIDTTDGARGRVIDYVRTLRSAGAGTLPGVRQLLPGGGE